MTASTTARGANLRRSAWKTRIAVFRARALTMVARPRLPSTATATPAGSVRVARRVSFPFENFSHAIGRDDRTLMLNRRPAAISTRRDWKKEEERCGSLIPLMPKHKKIRNSAFHYFFFLCYVKLNLFKLHSSVLYWYRSH